MTFSVQPRLGEQPSPPSVPVAINGGRLYGAFHCTNGDVVLFNGVLAPMFRWEARTGRVHSYTAGAPAAITGIERTDYYVSEFAPYPGKFFAQVLGDWVMASWNNRTVRCPRLPRPMHTIVGAP